MKEDFESAQPLHDIEHLSIDADGCVRWKGREIERYDLEWATSEQGLAAAWDLALRCRQLETMDREVDAFSARIGHDTQEFMIVWQGVQIAVHYTPNKWNVTTHLEIHVMEPKGVIFPITDTGYYSLFLLPGTIEAFEGGATAYVAAWLDEAAQSKEWRKAQSANNQLELF